MNTETRAWIGLGGEPGDAAATLGAAFSQLAQLPQSRLVARSALYRTVPVDASGPDYLNAVAGLDTTLSPAALLALLHDIERVHGRDRPFHHAPRTLDLDLLLHGDGVIRTPALCVPHPRLHLRAFVLAPLLEVAPALVHPELGPLAPWLARAADQGRHAAGALAAAMGARAAVVAAR